MIVIAGSPRKGMYSDRIAERFAGLTDSEIIYARNLRIGPCRACGYCKGAGNGTCVQKDDMPSVLESIRTSDGIALISPVYWWQTTAQIKLVIDRLYALRDGELKGKKLAVIMNGEAEDSDAEYRILSEQFSEMAGYLGMKYSFLGCGTPEGDEAAFAAALGEVDGFATIVQE